MVAGPPANGEGGGAVANPEGHGDLYPCVKAGPVHVWVSTVMRISSSVLSVPKVGFSTSLSIRMPLYHGSSVPCGTVPFVMPMLM